MLLRRVPVVLLAAILAACSLDISEPSPLPTAFVPLQQPAEQATATAMALLAEAEGGNSAAAWAHLNLSGRIIFTAGTDGVRQLDLATGQVATLFKPPERAWLTAVAAAPKNGRLALAYAPPPPGNEVQLGYTSLYTLPGDCGQRPVGCTIDDLEVLLERTERHEAYFSPVWSPDGRYLYFAHFTPSDSASGSSFKYSLERIALPGGQPELVVDNALWPSLSADGSRLVYVWFDQADFSDHLFVADADGQNAVRLLAPNAFEAVDSPLFTHDSQHVIFSAVGEGPSSAVQWPVLAWLDQLLGVKTALAHNVPSDWWIMPSVGGQPTRLTNIYEVGLFGAISPDGQHVAFMGSSGLSVMRADGTQITPLARAAGYGTLQWVP
jgi:Tol biopolymer transport system component